MELAKLSAIEAGQLRECETVIEQGMETFVEVGNALLTIREGRLWKGAYQTFENYVETRWKFTRRRANQLIEAASVVADLGNTGTMESCETGTIVPVSVPTLLPASEGQARPLSELPTPEEKREAWTEAVKDAPKDKAGKPKPPTAKDVKAAVQRVKAKRAPKPAPATEPKAAAPAEPETPTDVDEVGHAITDPKLVEVFADRGEFRSFRTAVSALRRRADDLLTRPSGTFLRRHHKEFGAAVGSMLSVLRFSMPYAVCPYCGGRTCETCRSNGWLPEEVYKAVPADIRGE